MQIRTFREADRVAVIELWETCGLTRPWNNPDQDISRKLRVQPELFFVGELDSNIIASAMAGYDGHRGSVYYLAVLPSYQGRGFGRQLMQKVESCLHTMGCPKLNLDVRSTNETVVTFYTSAGYLTDDVVSLGKRLIADDNL